MASALVLLIFYAFAADLIASEIEAAPEMGEV